MSVESSALLRPTLVVHVGVTGHRALRDDLREPLRCRAAVLFRALADEARRLHREDQARPVPLYRPDPPILRCLVGIAIGADTLLADAALQEGWTLVVILPFPRAEFERDFAPADVPPYRDLLARAETVVELDGDRARGGEPYAEVGRDIVEQSDVLVAVWDGLPPRGPGGTGDVVRLASERAVPTAVLAPENGGNPVWTGAADAGTALGPLLSAAGSDGYPAKAFEGAVPSWEWADASVRRFERLLLIGATVPPATPEPEPPDDGVLRQGFATADRLAAVYAARFRAAGLMRYGLVVPATAGAFVANFGSPWAQPFGYLVQFGCVLAVIAFSARGRWTRDQRRFVAYRALAEYLRSARMLRPLGTIPPAPTPAHETGCAPDWVGWYGRAAIRQDGPHPPATLPVAVSLVRCTATAQISFLRNRAARCTVLARRLRRGGIGLSLLGTAFIAAHAAAAYAGLGGDANRWLNQLALMLPALSPVLLGLLSFGDYGRLAERYSASASELETLLGRLAAAAPRREAVLPVVQRIAGVMQAETANWRVLVQSRSISAF